MNIPYCNDLFSLRYPVATIKAIDANNYELTVYVKQEPVYRKIYTSWKNARIAQAHIMKRYY